MNHSGQLFSLFAMILFGLSSCFKQTPIEDDINQRKAAIHVAEQYVSALKNNQLEKAMNMSTTPYWLDGDILYHSENLEKELHRVLAQNEILKHLKTVNARFFAKADLEIFAPRLLSKLQEKQIQGDYFVALQMIDSNTDREPQGILFFMQLKDGMWLINGLSD